MPAWIVTYASMPIEAETAEEAIARDGNGGGHWHAYPVHPDRPEIFDLDAEVSTGDAALPVLTACVGPAQVHVYQHRVDDHPLPVVVIEADVPDHTTEVRVYVNDTARNA